MAERVGTSAAKRERELRRALEALRAVAVRRRKPTHALTRREYASAVADEPELAGLPSGPEVARAFGGWERARERAALVGDDVRANEPR